MHRVLGGALYDLTMLIGEIGVSASPIDSGYMLGLSVNELDIFFQLCRSMMYAQNISSNSFSVAPLRLSEDQQRVLLEYLEHVPASHHAYLIVRARFKNAHLQVRAVFLLMGNRPYQVGMDTCAMVWSDPRNDHNAKRTRRALDRPQ